MCKAPEGQSGIRPSGAAAHKTPQRGNNAQEPMWETKWKAISIRPLSRGSRAKNPAGAARSKTQWAGARKTDLKGKEVHKTPQGQPGVRPSGAATLKTPL